MEEDVETFIKGTLQAACESAGFCLSEVDRAGFCHFSRADGDSLTVYATTLGSLLSVTASSEPSGAVRTMQLTPAQARSETFILTHLVLWLANGGAYQGSASAHFQGLSADLLNRVSRYLDGASSENLRTANKSMYASIIRRKDQRTPQRLRTPTHTWHFYHVA